MLDTVKTYFKNIPFTIDCCMCITAGFSLTGAFVYVVYSLVNPSHLLP